MTNLLDRLLVRSYLKAYVGCLVSLLGLYIIVDLFTHVDDFFNAKYTFWQALGNIGYYYGVRTTEIFDRLCEMIVLLAAMFTIAWMQRSNELLPLLSAGVSTRRVVAPVLAAASGLMFLSVVNQEFLIPRFASALLAEREDLNGEKEKLVSPTFLANGVVLTGQTAVPREKMIRELVCMIPLEQGSGSPPALRAKEARYVPFDAAQPKRTGGWELTGAEPPELEFWNNTALVEPIGPGRYFFYSAEADYDTMTRDRKWFHKASTWQIYRELSRSDSSWLASMAVVFHCRLTRPLMGMILLFLGLSVILRDQNRNVFISAGLCLCLCAVYFAAQFACKQLGDSNFISPALAAWLPVLIFGPPAFVMFDAIHT